MAFHDKPFVDRYSTNSEESERELRKFLNQKSGFICRADVPDKGCDFDTELIVNENEASNWRFPIQLKSEETITTIEEGRFIAYSFETSRLGYLMNRLPCSGLIVLYSIRNNTCYFEYTDKVYERLLIEREGDSWKQNEKVNIHIPANNILTLESAKNVYETFLKRFEQAAIMQQSFGQKYNLPLVILSSSGYDFNNTGDIKKFLVKYGMFMLDDRDITRLFTLISQIPNSELATNRELLFIAAVVFSEAGKLVDSSFYIKKLRAKNWIDEQIKELIDFTELKNDLGRGDISSSEFLIRIEKLREQSTTEENKISFDINRIFYQLLNIKPFEKIPQEIINGVAKIYDRIDKSNFEERIKWILRIWNSDNFSLLIQTISNGNITSYKIRESQGDILTLEEKKATILYILSLQQKLFETLKKAEDYAKEHDDNLLRAYTVSLFVRHCLSRELDYLSFNNRMVGQDNKQFQHLINQSLAAHDLFLNERYLKDAYNMLSNALELRELVIKVYGLHVEFPDEKVQIAMKKLEEELDLEPYELKMNNTLETIGKNNNIAPSSDFLANLNDEQLENFAKIVLKGQRLPSNCFQNLFEELKAFRLFHQRCTNSDIEILKMPDYFSSVQNQYQVPSRFILRNKITKIQTAPSQDMDHLLISWGF